MRSRLTTLVIAVTLTSSGVLATSGPASAEPAHCVGWTRHPKLYNAGGVQFGNGTYIYDGPYTDCIPLGQGYPSHGINVHCSIANGSFRQWMYLIDTTTGVAGWARYDSVNGDKNSVPDCFSG